MAFETGSGSSLSISSALPATYDAAGYAALSWVNVAEITGHGDLPSITWNLVTHSPLATRYTDVAKGNARNGTYQPTLAWDISDAGQEDINDALTSDNSVALKIGFRKGDVIYASGLCMSFVPSIPDSEGVVTATPTFEIDKNPPVLVAA